MVFIESMEDCKTNNQMKLFFEEYNNYNPIDYAKLAIRKLSNLNENKKNNLEELINNNCDIEGRIGWDAYCNILSIDQINNVGW